MKKILLIGAAALAMGFGSAAQAATIFLDSVTDAGGGNSYFNYRIEFGQDEGVEPGSKLVIYDFVGYVPGTITTGGSPLITASIENSSGFQDLAYTDDAAIPNLVFTYNGATRLDLSNVTYTNFGAQSIFSSVGIDGFSGLTVKTAGVLAGTQIATQGAIGVPAAIPEPATWAMMIGGFGLVGASLRRRHAVALKA